MPAQTCLSCGAKALLELEMKTKAGTVLTRQACSRCEVRTWLADGQPVELADVLKITNGDPEFAVKPSAKSARRAAARG